MGFAEDQWRAVGQMDELNGAMDGNYTQYKEGQALARMNDGQQDSRGYRPGVSHIGGAIVVLIILIILIMVL
jgi:hypothetical protein